MDIIHDNLNVLRSFGENFRNNRRFGRDFVRSFEGTIAARIAVICEAILYLCCLQDADENGTIPFPDLKGLKDFSGRMFIPNDIREASTELSKAEVVDFASPISTNKFVFILSCAKTFLNWIIENNHCADAELRSHDLLEMVHRLRDLINFDEF